MTRRLAPLARPRADSPRKNGGRRPVDHDVPRGAVLLAAVVAALTLVAAPAWASGSDSFGAAKALDLGMLDGVNVASYGIEAQEPGTPNGASPCTINFSDGTSATSTMYKTEWYAITGTGKSISVKTYSSTSQVDTVLSVYTGTALSDLKRVACADDYSDPDPSSTTDDDGTDQLSFASTAGVTYYVQAGLYCGAAGTAEADCSPTLPGTTFGLKVGPPRNDARADAVPLPLGTALSAGDAYAGLETGEDKDCSGTGYGATDWWRVDLPAKGHLNVTAQAPKTQTVVAIYPLTGQRIACGAGAAAADLATGSYLVQVGAATGWNTEFQLQATFVASPDQDGDGVQVPADCNDHDPSIPGPEIPNNDVDEDCSGGPLYDKDLDGVPDALDKCPTVNAAKRDLNHDGCLDPVKLDAALIWKIVGGHGGVFVKTVSVKAPRGATVRVSCTRRGCPRRARRGGGALAGLHARKLRNGTVVRIAVAQRGFYGRSFTYRVARNSMRQTGAGCLAPGSFASARCP
jgi:hypothetical protein